MHYMGHQNAKKRKEKKKDDTEDWMSTKHMSGTGFEPVIFCDT